MAERLQDIYALLSRPYSLLILAFILDLCIGDPLWLPHPVRIIGGAIAKTEAFLRRWEVGGGRWEVIEKLKGSILVITIILPVFFITWFIVHISTNYFKSYFLLLISYFLLIYLTSTTLATKGLIDSAYLVIKALKDRKIEDARKNLKQIVGRDTDSLDEKGVVRATIESLAENTSDGIIAPLFYFSIGGLPLAMTYKAINTLDSMVGYKNERYRHFGWASARLDDIMNYIPARLTGMLIISATFIRFFLRGWREIMEGLILRKPAPFRRFIILIGLFLYDLMVLVFKVIRLAWLHSKRSFLIMIRDGRRHPSLNSGIPEAALAGSLGIRLGGPSRYGGALVEKPYIGEEMEVTGYSDLEASWMAMDISWISAILGLGIAVIILYIRSQA